MEGRKRGTRGAAAAAAAAAAPPPVPSKGAKRMRSFPEVLGVAFNREGSAPQLSISRDAMEVAGDGKGYRMARANTGVREGHWYFELEVLPPPPGLAPGHVRVGWAAITGELQAPVGYDQWSYGFRGVSGSRVHKSERHDGYGAAFQAGDVVGCAIYLSPPRLGPVTVGGLTGLGTSESAGGGLGQASLALLLLAAGDAGGEGGGDGLAAPLEFAHLDAAASHVRFYVNGVDQGVAFDSIPSRTYYPAVSCYGGGRVRANFGPVWLKPPPGAASAVGAPCNTSGSVNPSAPRSSSGALQGAAGAAPLPAAMPPPLLQPAAFCNAPGAPLRGEFPMGFGGAFQGISAAAAVGPLRAVADLKPLPKAEAEEHAQAIAKRRTELDTRALGEVSSADPTPELKAREAPLAGTPGAAAAAAAALGDSGASAADSASSAAELSAELRAAEGPKAEG